MVRVARNPLSAGRSAKAQVSSKCATQSRPYRILPGHKRRHLPKFVARLPGAAAKSWFEKVLCHIKAPFCRLSNKPRWPSARRRKGLPIFASRARLSGFATWTNGCPQRMRRHLNMIRVVRGTCCPKPLSAGRSTKAQVSSKCATQSRPHRILPGHKRRHLPKFAARLSGAAAKKLVRGSEMTNGPQMLPKTLRRHASTRYDKMASPNKNRHHEEHLRDDSLGVFNRPRIILLGVLHWLLTGHRLICPKKLAQAGTRNANS